MAGRSCSRGSGIADRRLGATAAGAVLFTWFCIPECSGKTLEEIDELFLEGVSVRKFRKTRATVPTAQYKGDGKKGDMKIESVEV